MGQFLPLPTLALVGSMGLSDEHVREMRQSNVELRSLMFFKFEGCDRG